MILRLLDLPGMEEKSLMEMRGIFLTVIAAGVVVVAGSAYGEKLRVASLHPVATDLARRIGGDRVEVVEIVRSGGDPHHFEPGPSEIRAVAEARIVLAAGLGLESYLPKLMAATSGGPQYVLLGKSVKPLRFPATQGSVEMADPHWWQSLSNVSAAARKIRDVFGEADPEGRDGYEARASALLASLESLKEWAALEIASLPKSVRVLVTPHDGFGYFARDFGFVTIPLMDIKATNQPTPQRVSEIIAKMRARGVRAVFAEQGENPKALSEIMRETGARMGGELIADGPGSGGVRTYEEMMRHNISTIVEALRPAP